MLFNISLVQNMTNNLVNIIIQIENKTWENAHWEYLAVVDIPESIISDEKREEKACQFFKKLIPILN